MPLIEVLTTTTSTAKRFFGLLTILLLWSMSVSAQPKRPDEDEIDNDTQYEIALENYEIDSTGWAKFIRPRSIGFGITLGSNTVVEQHTYTQLYKRAVQGTTTPQGWTTFPSDSGPSRSFSYEGLLSFGVTGMLQASDRIGLELTYLYSKNVGDRVLYGLPPVVTNIIETSFLYSLNPYNKVNFVPHAGVTLAIQSGGKSSITQIGVNAGMGIGINIPTSIGLFYPMVNVRFNVMFGTVPDANIATYPVIPGEDQSNTAPDPDRDGVRLHYNSDKPSQLSVDKADITTLYSIPRLSIMFFPNF